MKNVLQITLTQALEGYRLHADARRLSPNTMAEYENTFKWFLEFLEEDPPITDITKTQVEKFLASRQGLSNKTVLNYHTGLSALWTWAVGEEICEENIIFKYRKRDWHLLRREPQPHRWKNRRRTQPH